jgi:two-component system NtrC family sensor kinase
MNTDTQQTQLNTFAGEWNHRQVKSQPEAMTLMGEHVAGVAHEMRNLLAIIQMQARFLPMQKRDTPGFQDSLTVIQEQARRMAHLVDNLLAFGDSRTPWFEKTDVNALLRYVVDLQADLCRADDFQLVTDLEPSLPLTQADPFQLEQVFVNLIKNAREAATGGNRPGRLTISTTLTNSRNGSPPQIQIRFADNGPGIPAEALPHLFEPFFTTKRFGQGVGLGLSLCEKILRAHQGRIWAENAGGGGAVFILELPVRESTQVDEPEPGQATRPPLTAGKVRILVVDDEPFIAKTTEEMLSRAGFDVAVASNGRQALEKLAQERIDLIISDLKMPEMDGPRFYELVMSLHPHLQRRIIFSTGDSGGKRARAFLQRVGCAQIHKPFQADVLLRKVYEALLDNGDTQPQPERRG